MSRLGKLLKKLATGEITELNYRAREEWTKRQERAHHRRGGSHFTESDFDRIFNADFLKSYRSGNQIRFGNALRDRSYPIMPGFKHADQYRNWLDSTDQNQKREIVARADRICGDQFPIFSLGFLSYGSPPRWNYDPVNDRLAPASFYDDIPYLNAASVGDSKVIWEISRWQFVYDLGQAYLVTGEEKYPRKFFELVNDWSNSHSDYEGIVFCSALEFAFRAHSLMWALDFFHSSTALDDPAGRSVYRLLYMSGMFLENHLSRYFSPNTHLFGEAWGLCLLGLLFPEFQASERWHALGNEIVMSERELQFTEEGLHAELSTAYHAYCVEFLAVLIAVTRQRGRTPPPQATERLKQAVEVLASLQRPDGLWPHIGDEDGGRALFLSRVGSHDFRPIMESAKAVLSRLDGTSFESRYPETFFLAGPSLHTGAVTVTPKRSSLLHDAGYCVLRSETERYLLFQAGRFGHHDCPHSHADMLHFDYSVGKDNFIIDPGTFVYTGNVARRNIYRSGAMHNGPCVSGIHSPTDPFGWRQRPDCTITEQRVTESRPVVAATYSLTDINDSRINVGRRVEYTGDGIWVISDEISGNGQFTASWNFVSPHQIETLDSLFRFRGQQSELRFFPIAVAGALTTFVESSTYSDDYLAEQPASSIKAQAIGEGRIFVIWLMQVEADPESRIFSVKCEDQKRILAETNSRVLSLEIKSAMEKSDK